MHGPSLGCFLLPLSWSQRITHKTTIVSFVSFETVLGDMEVQIRVCPSYLYT